MGNNLNADITDRFVLLKWTWFKPGIPQAKDEREWVFFAQGGFGCSPHTMGNAVIGEFVVDGEECRVEGYHLQNEFATAEQVQAALDARAERVTPPGRHFEEMQAAFAALRDGAYA